MSEKQVQLGITGMTCAACSTRIEKVLNRMEGVSAQVNLAMEDALITYNNEIIDLNEIESKIQKLGYDVEKEQIELDVEGMTCAACSNRIEKVLNRMEGVEEATVNLANETAQVRFQSGVLQLSDIIGKIQKLGYDASVQRGHEDKETKKEKELSHKRRRLLASILLSAPLLLTMLVHFFQVSFLDFLMNPWLQFALATPVQFVIGWPFYEGAYKNLRNKTANMDVLVALGTSAAYFYSVVEAIRGTIRPTYEPSLYFETSAVLITLILVGKYFEAIAKGRTTAAISSLVQLQAKEATVLVNGEEKRVAIDQVQVNDRLLVKPGEKFPVDGMLLKGFTTVDESMLTGESMPVDKAEGDKLIGATLNKNGTVEMQATQVGNNTALANIIKVVEEAQGSKAPIQRLADRISGVFVPIVIGIAFITFLLWYTVVDPGQLASALEPAIAVLVIACPCALGLATPTSIMVGSGKGAESGILYKGGEYLESTHRLTTVVFDKTGTLTVGKPVVTDYLIDDESVLPLLTAAESQSEHPIAEAIVQYGVDQGYVDKEVTSFNAKAGYGIEASIHNSSLLIGTKKLLSKHNVEYDSYVPLMESLEEEGKTAMLVAVNGEAKGVVAVADQVKQDARAALASLSDMGIKLVMLTGDNRRTAEAIASDLGIDQVIAEVVPEEKEQQIKHLQSQGEYVAMVGDGINDAPALARADVGIAIGTGTDVAIEAADVTIMGGDLHLISKAIRLSHRTIRNIRQNLFWALFYNSAGIPIAALGLLAPWIAGAAMAFSSVSVVSNSLRLKRVKL
ncbi:ATPase P [Pontibacillus halophilus JSM 076056 = DSM 19796]|uniref:Copper-exporting P-type ATPase n=1 Tax=Pontibacillus halophilus JSM 076056 = DSM 19796 TaxID=1385510 RepID=A0A0A5GNL1_9BACI|nr:heavy metal translocating P-type ATPase [Pontibacillus halophilus]KGX92838.1 ATPase P [Pontibacillus halophilus JSM 076056 = DSM 19796]